jgi:hypothetical protein
MSRSTHVDLNKSSDWLLPIAAGRERYAIKEKGK